MKAKIFSDERSGLKLIAYAGTNKVLLAMSLDDSEVDEGHNNLAGFAIWRQYPDKPEQALANRISFTVGVSDQTTAETRVWTDSDKAPFQKFRWVDVPPDGFDQPLIYRVRALYFAGQGTAMRDGPETTVTVEPAKPHHSKFRPAFTRGYIASQAYADKFHNAPIRPSGPKTPDFDPAPYIPQYNWLGAEARVALFDFLTECEQDKQSRVDAFFYDDDDPETLAAVCRIAKAGRLRAVLDNASLHVDPDRQGNPPPEVRATERIIEAAGEDNVKQGRFARYQHNKAFIKRDGQGKPEKVLLGSMNFSIRGLYVQANNVIVVDDPDTAAMFGRAFDVAFENNVKAPPFRNDPISQSYMVGSAADSPTLPKFSVALSPHKDWNVSLKPMTDRIRSATSSVLFAVMEPNGQGPVLTSLRSIAAQPTVFSYGTVETDKGLTVQSPNGAMGAVTGFAALSKNVPAPFKSEYSGGSGKHIHDKFVVVDFNAPNPSVFTGSSNLASGGETENGDSLVMIEDGAIATMYAIEAVAIFDHYHFRKAMQKATKPHPLTLWYPGKPNQPIPWWKAYYDPSKIQLRDRCLFAQVPLPADVATTKTVDWTAIDEQAPAPRGTGGGKTTARKSPAKKSATKKSPVKKAATKKRVGKKTATKKTIAKRAGAKKATTKKTTRKSAPVKRASAKKSPAKKSKGAMSRTSAKKRRTRK